MASAVAFWHEHLYGLPKQFLSPIPEQPLRLGINQLNAAVATYHDHRVGGGFDCQPHALFCLQPLSNIAKHEHNPGNITVGVADRRGAIVDGDFAAVFRNEARMVGKTDNPPLAQDFGYWVFNLQSGRRIADDEYLFERFPRGLILIPA